MRCADNDNYVLAFSEPVQRIIAVHERQNGNFGPHVTSARVEGLAPGPVVLETAIAGAELQVLLRDSQGGVWQTGCKLATLLRPGAVGVYCDQAAASAQEFDDFEVEAHWPTSRWRILFRRTSLSCPWASRSSGCCCSNRSSTIVTLHHSAGRPG